MNDLVMLAAFVIPIAFIVLVIRSGDGKRKRLSDYVCTQCGATGAKEGLNGSAAVELLLWCLFILPGLVYTWSRTHNRPKICKTCGSSAMVPLDSPRGQQLAEQFSPATAPKTPASSPRR